MLEIIKDDAPNVRDIMRRVLISVLLLLTFDWAIDSIAVIGDAVTERIDGLNKLSEVLSHLGPSVNIQSNIFSLRETAIYVFSLAAYIVAYVGFFTATALTHFVWTVLYICSPLMILMYVSPKTSQVTSSLYKGLIQVVIWKIFYSILGVLLLKLAMQSQVNGGTTGLEDYLLALIVNLCIGVSMLFIPIATRSLVSDGLSSVASTLAMAPALAAAGTAKLATSRLATGVKGVAGFASKPLTNPVTGRYQLMKERFKPKFDKFKQSYSSIGLPRELKKREQNQRKKDWRR